MTSQTTVVILLPGRRLFLLFLSTMLMDPPPVLLIFYMFCMMWRHLLSSFRELSSFSRVQLISLCFASFAFTILFISFSIRSILSALQFQELHPFVNITMAPRQGIYAEKFKHHIMWQGQNRSVLFTMLGSVQGCHLVEPTTIGQHACKSITIVPYGHAWHKFYEFLGRLYGQGSMRGPFEYGCLLTLSGRREGYTSPGERSLLFVCILLTHLLLCLS